MREAYIKNGVTVREETLRIKQHFRADNVWCNNIRIILKRPPPSGHVEQANAEVKINICRSRPQEHRVQNIKGPCTNGREGGAMSGEVPQRTSLGTRRRLARTYDREDQRHRRPSIFAADKSTIVAN